MVKIAVRLDDITPDMDWKKFLAFKKVLDQYGIKPLIGVIPFNRDESIRGSSEGAPEDFWKYIKELKEAGWCVALHGYNHIYTTGKGGLFPLNHFSEFAGVPYETQLEYLTEGKKELEAHGVKTDIFMAPAHSYDKNTLRALKAAGFSALTDGFGRMPYSWKGLKFYPISFLLKRTLRQRSGFSTLVVHTGTVNNPEMYHQYFGNTQVKWIDYAEYLSQAAETRFFFGRLGEYLLAYGKGFVGKMRHGRLFSGHSDMKNHNTKCSISGECSYKNYIK